MKNAKDIVGYNNKGAKMKIKKIPILIPDSKVDINILYESVYDFIKIKQPKNRVLEAAEKLLKILDNMYDEFEQSQKD
jgi:hypothetical protein